MQCKCELLNIGVVYMVYRLAAAVVGHHLVARHALLAVRLRAAVVGVALLGEAVRAGRAPPLLHYPRGGLLLRHLPLQVGFLQSHFFIWLSAFFFGVALLGGVVWLGPSWRAYEVTLYVLWLLPLTLPHLLCVLFRAVLFYLVLFYALVVLGGFMQYYASCVVGYGVAFTMRCICGSITP